MELAADANVLLAAISGGRTKLVLEHPDIEEVLSPAAVLEEVHEYVRELAAKKRLPEALLLMTLISLPITVVDRADYSGGAP